MQAVLGTVLNSSSVCGTALALSHVAGMSRACK